MEPVSILIKSSPFGWRDIVSLAEGLAIVAASIVAIAGFSAWRRETTGKRKIELAEEVLAALYEAEEVVRFIRNPFTPANEGAAEMQEAEGKVDGRIPHYYVVRQRYKQSLETFTRLHASRYRLMAYFGKDAGVPVEELAEVVRDIQLAARMLHFWEQRRDYFLKRREEGAAKRAEEALEEIEKAQALLFFNHARPDEVSLRINAVVDKVENVLRPFLAGSP